MSDLVEFLTARLDEDEATALAADKSRWLGTSDKLVSFEVKDAEGAWETVGWVSTDTRDNEYHIARWDPVRVLAEVAAKRQVLAAYEAASAPFMADKRAGLWVAVKALATAYSDHPDFAAAWERS